MADPVWVSRAGFDELAAVLPSGRAAPAVPAAARQLVDHARGAGWRTLLYWGEASGGAPFLGVELGIAEPKHHYKVTWHSFNTGQYSPGDDLETADVSTLRLRLFSKIVTTNGSYWHDAPSLTAITAVITNTQPHTFPGES